MAFWDQPAQPPTIDPPFPIPPMRPERRRAFRRVVMRDGLLAPADYATDGTAGHALRAVVVDMSCVGVGLRMRQCPDVGATYTLTVPDLTDIRDCRVRVTDCRPCKGDQFQVGAEFV